MSGQSIAGSRCKMCDRVIVPPRETCPYCGKKAGLTEANFEGDTRQNLVRVYFKERLTFEEYESLWTKFFG